MTRPRPFAVSLAVLALLAAAVAPAAAQQQLAAIQGTITDQTGAVLPGVTVVVTNVATGISRTTTTNEVGVYRMPSLDPGRYEVSAELTGFKKVVRRDVVLSVGATVGLNFTLEAGAIAEELVVVGISPDIQTEKAEVSAVVERKKIVDLPLVSRNPLALAGLQPGVVGLPSGAHLFVTEQGLGVNANGQRESGNNAQVDGITISGGPWGGSMLLVPNPEAVEEFQIIVNNPSAEYGRNAGAAVAIITRSGTNQLAGSFFEFHRSEALRARNIFEQTKPPFERNEFGASLGGPIRRDSTFFFFSYDGLRQKGGGAALRTVETEQLVNWVQATRPNSIAAQLFRKYPPPMYPTSELRDLGAPLPGANRWSTTPDGIPDVGTISLALPSRNIGDQFSTRVDQTLRQGNDRIRASYYANRINNPFVYIRPQFDHDFTFLNQLLTSGYTRVINDRTLNELNFGWVRQHGEAGDPTPEAPTIGISGLSYGFGVDFWHPITFTQNNFEIRNVLTMNVGEHSFRVGGELRHGRDGAILHHWERPNYFFTSILDFVDDEPFSETRAVDPVTGLSTVAPGTYITNEWGLFIQDNWKARPNLTLNLGLRYENFGNPRKKEGPFNGIILGPGSTRQEQIAGARVAAVDRLYETDWNNFAPRLGVAWDVTGDARWVVRAGAGVSYNRINNTVFSDERLNPPAFAAASTNIFDPRVAIRYTLGPNYPPNPALGRGLDERGGIRGSRVNLRVVDPELTIPYSFNWFAGIQRELPGGFVLDVNYIGSAMRKLLSGDGPGGENYNRFSGDLFDGRLDRLNPSFGVVGLAEARIPASYHGLATQVSRRYRGGLAFQTAYTFGKAIDRSGFPEEVGDIEREKGPAGHDRRHSLKLNAIWEIPFRSDRALLEALLGGWQINAVTVYESGPPFSVVCNLPYPRCDFNADGQSGERVNVRRTDLGRPSREQWLAGVLSAADYSLPAAGTLSTQPRNAFTGPAYFNTDLSVVKSVRIPWQDGRSATLQVRVEAFNVFNAAHLANPVSAVDSPVFGQVRGLRRDPRIIQLGARFSF
ncbi:MAG TPA: TonB-dependent receptor [Vicinamibacterales bacterium]|nr:TonB-dependent receptor [Vicinamibacterales bacterium]